MEEILNDIERRIVVLEKSNEVKLQIADRIITMHGRLIINMIVACNNKNVIGSGNSIPWNCPEDLKYFKDITKSSIVVMGRTTWESLPSNSRPLKDRINVVISTTMPRQEGVIVLRDINEAVSFIRSRVEDVFVIGGESIYSQFISRDLIDCIFLTKINNDENGDKFFSPTLLDNFELEYSHDGGESCQFLVFRRSFHVEI